MTLSDDSLLLPLLERLPASRPFTPAEADARGVDSHARTRLLRAGFLVRPVRGVYHRADLEQTLELRVAALEAVVPSDCVVTDRTAAWLHGVEMALPPGAHLETPPVSVFAPPGRRLRNGLCASGERGLAPSDITEVGGILVTTLLRTACDLSRLLPPAYALGTVDLVAARGGFGAQRLVAELDRFKGYRGIVSARVVAPYVDPRSGSLMEGVSRWGWLGAGLPRPECQVEVPAPVGSYFIDIGLPRKKFGAEYDGVEFHGAKQRQHDWERREWMRRTEDWTIVVLTAENVIGRHRNVEALLREAWKRHLRGPGRP